MVTYVWHRNDNGHFTFRCQQHYVLCSYIMTPSSIEVKNRVELYLYFPFVAYERVKLTYIMMCAVDTVTYLWS